MYVIRHCLSEYKSILAYQLIYFDIPLSASVGATVLIKASPLSEKLESSTSNFLLWITVCDSPSIPKKPEETRERKAITSSKEIALFYDCMEPFNAKRATIISLMCYFLVILLQNLVKNQTCHFLLNVREECYAVQRLCATCCAFYVLTRGRLLFRIAGSSTDSTSVFRILLRVRARCLPLGWKQYTPALRQTLWFPKGKWSLPAYSYMIPHWPSISFLSTALNSIESKDYYLNNAKTPALLHYSLQGLHPPPSWVASFSPD